MAKYPGIRDAKPGTYLWMVHLDRVGYAAQCWVMDTDLDGRRDYSYLASAASTNNSWFSEWFS